MAVQMPLGSAEANVLAGFMPKPESGASKSHITGD